MSINPFDNIKNLNPAPVADLDVTDKVPVINTADGQAYTATMGQIQDFVLNGGTIDPNFDDVTADTITVNGTGNAVVVPNGDLVIADKIIHSGDTNTAMRFPSNDTFTVEANGTEYFRVSSALNGATELISGTQYPFASLIDIGSDPNEVPLNQYLGALAYKDTELQALDIGTGITTGTGTICKAHGGPQDGVFVVRVVIDLTGLNAGGTAGDIIGVNGTALPCYIARIPTMTVLGGRMTCLEAPAGGDTDIDLYSATEGTGVEDQAISALTETQLINGGVQSLGTVTVFAADPTVNAYLYLVGQAGGDATYTAGRFLIEIFGV